MHQLGVVSTEAFLKWAWDRYATKQNYRQDFTRTEYQTTDGCQNGFSIQETDSAKIPESEQIEMRGVATIFSMLILREHISCFYRTF
jgi:hypothetical protein